MTYRTGMNQVRFKVRHNALLLQEFTVADMVRATGLNPESVRTELQRMKQEGLLAAHLHPDKPKKRGGRQALYKLTDDPEARLTLSQSIEAFYPSKPPADRPTSRYYLLAQQLLDRAQTAEELEREHLFSDAERDLEMAEQAEGGSLASERVRAYLQYEHARLAYFRNDYKEAERSFEKLHEFFVNAKDETMTRHIDEFRLCLNAQSRMAGMPGNVDEAAWARCLLDTLAKNEYQTDSPLTMLLLQLLRGLSQTADEKVCAAALALPVEVTQRRYIGRIRILANIPAIEMSQRDIIAEAKDIRFEQTRLPSKTDIFQRGERQPPLDWFQRDEPPPGSIEERLSKGMVGH